MPGPILLEDLDIYKLAMDLSDEVWSVVENWGYFSKLSVGSQFVRATDSVSANIAEGYGRYFYADRKKFYYYSRGSLLESKTWLEMAHRRKLVNQVKYESLINKMREIHLLLNVYIKSIKQNIA